MNPKITIYIVSHNYGRYLQNAIESVLCQTVDSWELFIINDNSEDDTSEIMERYKGDNNIRLFNTTGIGLPGVCNLAIKESQGEYIMRLDGDDILDENALLVLGNYLDRHTEVALVFPDYYLIDEAGQIYAEERRQKISNKNFLFDVPFNGACTLVRTTVLKEVGGYREDLGMQDGVDLWSKLKDTCKCHNVNIPLFYYRRHYQNLTNNQHHILETRRRIKMDSVINVLDNNRPLIAVIPCRRNYDFCLDLWKQEINGNSLLQRDIKCCLDSSLLDFVVVASDNHEVKEVISLFDDKRLKFFERKKEDTLLSKSLVPTLEKITKIYDSKLSGITVISYLQTTFLTTETIEESISTLVLNETDCAFCVEEICNPLYKRAAHGLQIINPPNIITTDFDKVYRETNTSLATRNINFKTGSLTGATVLNFIVSEKESFFINSPWTLEIARKIAE